MISKSLKEILLGSLPIMGEIKMYSGATAPKGWKFCDGSEISRATYAKLFDVIGTTYGAGDGSTTFALPDLQGRVPIGVSNDHALASSGGEETHTLTTAEMPAHSHNPANGTAYAFVETNSDSTLSRRSAGGSTTSNYITSTQAFYRHTATNSQGGGGAHNNMQPYLTINYIIYVGG